MGTTSVRRNLFNSNLSKRAVSSVPPMQGTSNNSFNLQSSSHSSSSETNPSSSNNARFAESDEIVVKDKNGSYKLDIPVLPVIVNEDGKEIEGFDEGHNGGGPGSAVDSTGETELGGREKERIEASLIEMMCRNWNRQMSSDPAEIYNLVQQSLRNKVAALDEDNWMYEPEVEPRV